MKILHVIDCMRIGGAQRRLFQLLKGLQESKDFENYLVLFSDEIDFPGLDQLNIRLIIVKTDKLIGWDAYKRLRDVVKKVKPDIVHSWQLITSFYATILSFKYRFRHLNAMINDSTRRGFFNKERVLARAIIPFAHVIISNSKAGLSRYKVKPGKNVFVIYNGFDFERLHRSGVINPSLIFGNISDTAAITIGMVARFEDVKDYPTVIKAVGQLLDEGQKLRFVAIGDGKNMSSCKALIDPNHSDSFFFLGKRSDIDSIVPLFDIGVLSTYSEGISNSIMEYMAFRKPVIASDCDGNSELVKDGSTGYLAKIENVEDWVNKLELLINDPRLRQSLGDNGYQRLLDQFHLDGMIEEYKKLYHKQAG